MRALFRSTSSAEVRELLRARVEAVFVDRIAARLTAPDARQRARVATSVLMGASVARTVFDPADLPEDDLAERLTVLLRTCLLGPVR